MADSEPDGFDDLTSPAAKIASLEDELQQTRCHLDCIVGKLAEAEGNYERVQCENAILQKQVALLKKELATFTHAGDSQAVNSPQGDHAQQCGPTNEHGKNLYFHCGLPVRMVEHCLCVSLFFHFANQKYRTIIIMIIHVRFSQKRYVGPDFY